MKVKQEIVVKLFEALGFKTAKSWDESRLLAKIKQLPELMEETKVKNPNVKKVVKKLLEADSITIIPTGKTGKAESSERPSEAAMRKSAKGKKKPAKEKATKSKKKPKEKKEKKEKAKAEVDRFGRRLGSQGALIDEKLSKTGKTMEAICKETKLPARRVNTHLKGLITKGFVKKDKNDKYFVIK